MMPPIVPLDPLTPAQIAYLQWAIARWTTAFKANNELTPNDLLCEPENHSALIDTINAHRYYLTQRRPCLCNACLPLTSAALINLLDMRNT